MAETLEVLRCRACDAPLVLGDGDTVACPSCGAANELPAAYRELHQARLADARLRIEAAQVLRRLDRPPSLAVKVLARIFDKPMLSFILWYGIPVGIAAIFAGLGANVWIAARFGYATPDDVPFAITMALMFVALFMMAFAPRALGIYANRRVTDRARLLGALAARPPKLAGGPASCRMCGAPLAVAPDETVAVCSYCRAENAVHLESPVLAYSRSLVAGLGREIRNAASLDRKERRGTLRKLFRELGRYAVRTVLLGGGFILGSQEDSDHRATTLAAISMVVTVLLLIYFVITSARASDEDADDAADRASGNDVPKWVGVLGPIGALLLLRAMFRFLL